MTIKLVQNDTLPVLNFTIKQEGVPIDLTGCTVKFYMVNADTKAVKINGKSCTVVSEEDGTARYSWATEDTDTVGSYLGEVEVTFPSGKIQTGFKQIPIVIRDDI